MAINVLNNSFEEPGVTYGQADNWSETVAATGEDIAIFNTGPTGVRPLSAEEFEDGWSSNEDYQLAFNLTDLLSAQFESLTLQYENFETSWVSPGVATSPPTWNHHSVWEFVATNFTVGMFDTGIEAYEDFEEYWGTSPYNQAFITGFSSAPTDPAHLSSAMFDGGTEAYEDFEETWQGNEGYHTGFSSAPTDPAHLSSADFDIADPASTAEDFDDGAWIPFVL